MQPKTLVFCSAGARIEHLPWLAGLRAIADMDAALVYYGGEERSPLPQAKFCLRNRDFKIPNFLQLLREAPEALDYELFMFVDDDIIVSAEQLGHWRTIVADRNLDISQPALTPESKADWPHVKFQRNLDIDAGQFVEIQCFALSRRALQASLPYFFMVKTGAGLDVALYRLACDRGLRSAVIHELQVVHPHRDEHQTVRTQFTDFSQFNTQMSRFMDFCFAGHARFEDLATASRVLGDTTPAAVRWIARIAYIRNRVARTVKRLMSRT